MATHKITIEVTDGELRKLKSYGYTGGGAYTTWTPASILNRVVDAAPEPKRYLKVGDVLSGGQTVTYVSPTVCVGRPEGDDTAEDYVWDRGVWADHRWNQDYLYLNNGKTAYFPDK